jgi:hypothetical protein
VLKTANAAGTNGLTCHPKHGDNKFWSPIQCCLTSAIARLSALTVGPLSSSKSLSYEKCCRRECFINKSITNLVKFCLKNICNHRIYVPTSRLWARGLSLITFSCRMNYSFVFNYLNSLFCWAVNLRLLYYHVFIGI